MPRRPNGSPPIAPIDPERDVIPGRDRDVCADAAGEF